MSKKRNEYIEQLLSDLKVLEERIQSVKESNTLPFSFFSTSFDRIESISRSLHELELMQIGEMKEQMERLVQVLSAKEKMVNPISEEDVKGKEQEDNEDGMAVNDSERNPIDKDVVIEREVVVAQESVSYTAKIVLPEYRDPRLANPESPSLSSAQHAFVEGDVSIEKRHSFQESHIVEKQHLNEESGGESVQNRSLNDTIQVPPALLDLKRGISLNDRFLFQRELFNNSRDEMNAIMNELSGMGGFNEAEAYLRRERNWNFEDQTVKDFLLIIKKGFE